MKMIGRRLSKLERRFGPEIETIQTRRLRERLAAARRRMAAMFGDTAPPMNCDPCVGLVERLHAGRSRSLA